MNTANVILEDLASLAATSLAAILISSSCAHAQQNENIHADLAFHLDCTQPVSSRAIEEFLANNGFKVTNVVRTRRELGMPIATELFIEGIDREQRVISYIAGSAAHLYLVALYSRPPTTHSTKLEAALLQFSEETPNCQVRQITRIGNGAEVSAAYGRYVEAIGNRFRELERAQEKANSWSTWNDTYQRVAFLYNTEQFTALETALKSISASQKTFVNGDSPAAAAYWVFRRMIPAPGGVEQHEAKAARWKSAVPESAFVTFLLARIAYAKAWNVRGWGYAGSVSAESWELFHVRLGEAEQILLNAPEELKGSPLWHNLLLAIILDNPNSTSKPDMVLEQAAKRWPRYFELYELRLTRLVPKWGGSWRQVEAFIDEWSQRLAASEGTSTYARLYASLRNEGVTPDETAMNWPRMKAGLEDLTRRYPSTIFKNLRASYACFARDKDSFRSALAELMPDDIEPQSWLSGHSYEACMRWAAI